MCLCPLTLGSWKYCVVPSFRKGIRGIQACLLCHSADMSTEFIACSSLNSPGKPVSWAIISLCPAQLGAREVHIVRGTQLMIPGVRICPGSTQSLGSVHCARLPLPYSGPTAARSSWPRCSRPGTRSLLLPPGARGGHGEPGDRVTEGGCRFSSGKAQYHRL